MIRPCLGDVSRAGADCLLAGLLALLTAGATAGSKPPAKHMNFSRTLVEWRESAVRKDSSWRTSALGNFEAGLEGGAPIDTSKKLHEATWTSYAQKAHLGGGAGKDCSWRTRALG